MNLLVSLQTLAWKKDVEIIAQMHRLRDDMRDTTKGGHVLCNEVPEKFGAASQPEIDGMAGLIAGFGTCFETPTQLHVAVDTEVIAPLLRLYAKVSGRFVRFRPHRSIEPDRCDWPQNLHASFRDRLQRLFPSAQVIHHLNDMKKDARVAILLPPIKSIERMLVKVHEYRLDKTSKWPHSLSVGDVLRATIVCADGDTLLEAWTLISSPTGFDVRPGNGRLKNLMATTLPRPPCMLINVIIDSDDGHRPVLAEVQIELRSIIELAMAQHKARTSRRVLSCSSPSHCLSAVWMLCCCSCATVLRNSPRENSG